MTRTVSVKIQVIILLLLIVWFHGRTVLSHVLSNSGLLLLSQDLASAQSFFKDELLPLSEEKIRLATVYDSENYSAWRGLGFVLLFQGDKDNALFTWQMVNNMGEELILWGNNSYAIKQFEDALTWYEYAHAIVPHSAKPLYYAGLVFISQEDLSEAVNIFHQAYEKPDSQMIVASLDFQMGRILQAIKPQDLELALNLFEEALESDQFVQEWERLDAHYYRGDILRRQGNIEEAVIEFAYVVDQEPKHYRGNVWLGELAWQLEGDLDKAKFYLNRAIATDPEQKWGYKRLAFIYVENDRLEEAAMLYARVLEIDPDDQTAIKFLTTYQE